MTNDSGEQKIKRYDLVGEYDPIMTRVDDGDFVRYEDHAKEVERLKATMTKELKKIVEQHELEGLRREIEALKADRDRLLTALEKYATNDFDAEYDCSSGECGQIAREALAKGEARCQT